MKIEGVVFDWAGTTVDFGSMAPVRAFMDTFAELGVPVTEAEARKPMGLLKRDHIDAILSMDRVKQAWENVHGHGVNAGEREELYRLFEPKLIEELALCSHVKPHVIVTAEALRQKGIRVGTTTGYTGKMVEVVVAMARQQGYVPDCCVSPDLTDFQGRPYPYMLFRNMEKLGLSRVRSVLKVGDTVADILEGKNAGVWTAGVTEGSSIMGLNEEEYQALTAEEKKIRRNQTAQVFRQAGADFVIDDLSGVLAVIQKLEQL